MMRSSLFRRNHILDDSSETTPLLPEISTPGPSRIEQAEAEIETSRPSGGAGHKLPQYIAALAATLGAFAAGTGLGWSSPVVFHITQVNSTDYNFPISTYEGDWVASIFNLGCAAACFPIGLIMDALGRRSTMLLLVLPFTLGWLLIILAPNIATLTVGRFITGFAGGAFCVTAPTYVSEITQDSIRGRLGSYFQLMVTSGVLFSYIVGSLSSVYVFNIICIFIPFIFGITFFFMPESPNYLVIKGKVEDARKSLFWLRGSDYDVDQELHYLRCKAEEDRKNPVSFKSSITKKTALKALLICYVLMLLQPFSGVNTVIFNTSAIFKSAGSTIPASAATIIIGGFQVLATFISTLIVDSLGRRILLLSSSLIVCICSTVLGIYFYLQDVHGAHSPVVESLWWLPLLSLSLFIFSFSIGLGPIPWMMAGELCLIDIKAFVSSTSCTINWLLSFVVTSTFNTLNDTIGRGQVFWAFASIMLFGFVFVMFVVPETKGKSAEEIQVILGAEPVPLNNASEIRNLEDYNKF